MRALVIEHSITKREEKSFDRYLTEISKFEVLSPEQEVALFRRVNQGDEVAKAKLIRHNLRFVVSVAKQYHSPGLWLGDLVNEGNIGLVKAVNRFDVSKGFKFISYAVWWIRQTILQAIGDKSRKIRLPLNQQGARVKVEREKMQFLQVHGRLPNEEELAENTGLSVDRIDHLDRFSAQCSSYDAKIKAGEDTALISLLKDSNVPAPDHELVMDETHKKQVNWLLSKLSPKEASVLSLLFGLNGKTPLTLGTVGELLDISKERVRQIRQKALYKLRRRGRDLEVAFQYQ